MRVKPGQPINKFHRVDDNCPNIGDWLLSQKINKLLPRYKVKLLPRVSRPTQPVNFDARLESVEKEQINKRNENMTKYMKLNGFRRTKKIREQIY